MKKRVRPKGEETRERILRTALARFRRHGFAQTTMRQIAAASGVALGAAYYYFPSKEAIVLSYYDETQRKCEARAREAFAKTDDVRERLSAAFTTKLDVLARDRKLLSALFQSIADPSAPLSVFGEKTRRVREESIGVFDEAIATSDDVRALDPSMRRLLVLALWSLHMGVLLYFIHDASHGQEKTRALVDRAVTLATTMLPLAPSLVPMFGAPVAAMLDDAGLLLPPR